MCFFHVRAIRKEFFFLPLKANYRSQVQGLAGTWEALFLYDMLLFAFTVVSTWKARKEQIPIMNLIFRDGKPTLIASTVLYNDTF